MECAAYRVYLKSHQQNDRLSIQLPRPEKQGEVFSAVAEALAWGCPLSPSPASPITPAKAARQKLSVVFAKGNNDNRRFYNKLVSDPALVGKVATQIAKYLRDNTALAASLVEVSTKMMGQPQIRLLSAELRRSWNVSKVKIIRKPSPLGSLT